MPQLFKSKSHLQPFKIRCLNSVIYFALSAIALCANAHAQEISGGWVIGGALTAGGDTVGEVEVFDNSNNSDTEKLKAGGLLYLYAGYNWLFQDPKKPTSIQLTFGYHSDFVTGGNDTVSFDRFPIDLIGYQHHKQWRAGLGLTYHLTPELDLKDAGAGKYDFDNALGALIEVGYFVTEDLSVNLRFTEIEYEINNNDFSGSNIGIGLSGRF